MYLKLIETVLKLEIVSAKHVMFKINYIKYVNQEQARYYNRWKLFLSRVKLASSFF
jgi:hypothetical protein